MGRSFCIRLSLDVGKIREKVGLRNVFSSTKEINLKRVVEI
jgi:hypothetical protein